MNFLTLFFLATAVSTYSCGDKNGKKKPEPTTENVITVQEPSSQPHSKPPVSGMLYEDIDLATLNGVGPLATISYPCIEIRDSADSKVILFHTREGRINQRIFYRLNSAWWSKSEYRMDTTRFYTIEFIKNKKLYSFNYTDTVSYKLENLAITEEDKTTFYFPNLASSINVRPGDAGVSLITSNYDIMRVHKIQQRDGITEETWTEIKKGVSPKVYHRDCYKEQKHSILWWTFLSPTGPKINCD